MNLSKKSAEEIAAAAKANAATYLRQIPPEADPARRILVEYSGIPPDAVDAHILNIVSQSPIHAVSTYTNTLNRMSHS